jgi:2-iminobutanoate/2-iminopropanoate deaminase
LDVEEPGGHVARSEIFFMIQLDRIQPEGLPIRRLNGHVLYSHVVAVASGRTIYVSGQLSRDEDGNIVGVGDMGAQIEQVATNLSRCLAAAGASFANLVKTTTYVTDIDLFFRYADVRARIFGASPPTSTTVEVRRLSHPDFLIEIDAVAVI